jgi:hypothetical protein
MYLLQRLLGILGRYQWHWFQLHRDVPLQNSEGKADREVRCRVGTRYQGHLHLQYHPNPWIPEL